MAKKKPSAVWKEKEQRWSCKVQKEGKVRFFRSSIPGQKGEKAAIQKALAWRDDDLDGEIKAAKLIDMFLQQEKIYSEEMHKQHESIMRLYVIPRIGAKKMSAVTEQNLQDALYDIYKKDLSKRYIKNAKDAISAFLKYARKSKVTTMTVENLHIPQNARVIEKKALRIDEIKTLFTSDKVWLNGKEVVDWYIYAYRTYVLMGLRPGELAGLELSDILTDRIRISRSINKNNKITQGKNKNARREILLPDIQKQIFADQRKMLLRNGIVSNIVFPDPDGERIKTRGLYTRWCKYQRHNGIEHISLYELRHTFVTMCQGLLDDQIVKDIAGHSKSMDTFGTYGHGVSIDVLKSAANIINKTYMDIIS